jgi:hypothetical protein
MRPGDDGPVWFVLIEQNTNKGEGVIWELTDTLPASDYNDAVTRARDLAFTFTPRHPMKPRQRSVYQSGDDVWISDVQGLTRSFHFRVSVVRWLGDAAR